MQAVSLTSQAVMPFNPTDKLQGFLIICDAQGGSSCSSFTTFKELLKIWTALKARKPSTAVAHIGFEFSLSKVMDAFIPDLQALAPRYPNQLLITAALKYTLPPDILEITSTAEFSVAGIPAFLCVDA